MDQGVESLCSLIFYIYKVFGMIVKFSFYMLYIRYLLKKSSLCLISKLYFKSLSQLPAFLFGFLVVWLNLQQYKRLRVLVFLLLNILTTTKVFISKKNLNFFFYIKVQLVFIFNIINVYLSNVDIAFRSLLLNKGQTVLELFLFYNKFPIILELDNFFEQVMNLLGLIEETIFGLKLYLKANTLISAETYLRFFKLPILLVK